MGDDENEVPWILLGGAPDWPEWLDGSPNRWKHIADNHGPKSTAGKPRFDPTTDIAKATYDTIVNGETIVWNEYERRKSLPVNGQNVIVPMRPHKDGSPGWFVNNSFPEVE
jgi:hypothetical protein